MKYTEVTFQITPYSQTASDLLAALLGEEGFETFEDTENGLKAYIQQTLWNEQQVRSALKEFPLENCHIDFSAQEAPYQDWNQTWEEEGFQPVTIGTTIVIHDTKHTNVPHMPYDICISPRQAFGTGNHYTTRMILQWISEKDLKGMQVVDAGTGTGVLSIMCVMKGAEHILAYDIDEWSTDNARDNLLLNGIGSAKVEVKLGDASLLKDVTGINLLIANINRNILLADMQTFINTLTDEGLLVLSGFYEEDVPMLMGEAERMGMHPCDMKTTDHWTMLVLKKEGKHLC